MDISTYSQRELVNEFNVTAHEIFNLTRQLNITGQPDLTEKEVNDYADLMRKRDPLVQKLTLLKQALDGQPIDHQRGDYQEALSRAEEQVKAIQLMDQQNEEVARHIMKTVRSSMKGIRNEKNLRNAYAHPMEGMMPGLLDTKQ